MKAARLVNAAGIEAMQARGHPMREAHTRLLPHLDFERGTRLTELAEAAGITKQSAQRLVDEMVDEGYLAKVDDPDDGRAKRIVYTALGRQGVAEGLEALDDVTAVLLEQLGPRRLSALDRTLDEVLTALDDDAADD